MENEIVQHFALDDYHINQSELSGMLLDFNYAPCDTKTMIIKQLTQNQTAKWPSGQDFLSSMYKFIVSFQEEQHRLTMKDHPELDPDFYTPPSEEIEREKQFDIDFFHTF